MNACTHCNCNTACSAHVTCTSQTANGQYTYNAGVGKMAMRTVEHLGAGLEPDAALERRAVCLQALWDNDARRREHCPARMDKLCVTVLLHVAVGAEAEGVVAIIAGEFTVEVVGHGVAGHEAIGQEQLAVRACTPKGSMYHHVDRTLGPRVHLRSAGVTAKCSNGMRYSYSLCVNSEHQAGHCAGPQPGGSRVWRRLPAKSIAWRAERRVCSATTRCSCLHSTPRRVASSMASSCTTTPWLGVLCRWSRKCHVHPSTDAQTWCARCKRVYEDKHNAGAVRGVRA